MLKLYVVILVFGKVAGFTGPMDSRSSCEAQAQTMYSQIISKAQAQGIKSVKADGRDAYEKDLSVICKSYVREPVVSINISQ